MSLKHYIIVRRDLTLGEVCAQITHAAGESFYLFAWRVLEAQRPGSSTEERSRLLNISGMEQRSVGGSIPPPGFVSNTVAVVLGARNEKRLLALERQLFVSGMLHVAIRETDGAHAGELMAIGIVPHVIASPVLENILGVFQLIRECAE